MFPEGIDLPHVAGPPGGALPPGERCYSCNVGDLPLIKERSKRSLDDILTVGEDTVDEEEDEDDLEAFVEQYKQDSKKDETKQEETDIAEIVGPDQDDVPIVERVRRNVRSKVSCSFVSLIHLLKFVKAYSSILDIQYVVYFEPVINFP